MNGDATEAALGLLGLSPHNSLLSSHSILPLKRKQSSLSSFNRFSSNESINCICGFTYDDGFSIACDDCSRWCHAACFDIVDGDVPEEWRCWVCVPRSVDRDRAVRLQKARQRQAQHQLLQIDQRSHPRIRSSPAIDRKPRRVGTATTANPNDAAITATTSSSTTASTTTSTAKRKRRSSINTPISTFATAFTSTEDEHIDIDDPWTQSYVHITHDIVPNQDTRDKLRRQAQHWRGVTALKSPIDSTHPTTPVHLPYNTLPVRTSVQPIPNSSFSHPTLSLNTNPSVRPPSYALHTTSPVPSSQFIAPYRSAITTSAAYLSDTLNAYAHLGLPKPFVHLFGPPFDLALDARIAGSKTRFLRNGCRPNAVLRPVICDTQHSPTITFGVFALRDLKANEEVILGWEWDDGHAVHSLPALIETPHMFPSLDSPHQIVHLRHQMANILHALSSTFTTCACGARAKDCALTQMAAFVDGEDTGERVDLGPLVGNERGFLTKEKVPLSGGIGGVEMVDAASEMETIAAATTETTRTMGVHSTRADYSNLPELTLSPATASPSPKKNGAWKGKERIVIDTGMTDSDSSGHDDRKGNNTLTSSPPRSGKLRSKRRVTIDSSPHHSPPLASPISARQASEDEMQWRPELAVAEPVMMPPKLRKRWIHQSFEALREAGAPCRGTVSGPRPHGSISSEGGERMDVDRIIEPPSPASPSVSTDFMTPPTTCSEFPRYLSAPHSPLAVSPSTSFAKLSLLSPIMDDMDPPRNRGVPSMPAVRSTIINRPEEGGGSPNGSDRGSPETSYLPLSSGPGPLSPSPPSFPSSLSSLLNDHPVKPISVPDALDTASQSLADSHGVVSDTDKGLPAPMHVDNVMIQISTSSPNHEPSPRSPTPHPRTPSPPTVPPPPKVKMSLKDFAMRKKRQREEEEMAKTTLPASPISISESLAEARMVETISSQQYPPTEQKFPPLSPSTAILPLAKLPSASPPPVVPSRSIPDLYCETLEAKVELTELTLPRGLVGPDDRENSPAIPDGVRHFPSPLNGDTEKEDFGKAARVFSAVGPAMHADGLFRHSRRSSREDGEIMGGTSPKQSVPSLLSSQQQQSLQHSHSFVPRSHSPPTQPRSFQSTGAVASTSVSVSTPPGVVHSTMTPPPMHNQGRSSSHSSSPIGGSVPPPYRYRSQSQSHLHSYSYSQHQQQQGSNLPSSRPLPRGPRALQNNSGQPNRMYGGTAPGALSQPPFIPRGPSADRERIEWERDRGWSARPRGRGGGNGAAGWGR